MRMAQVSDDEFARLQHVVALVDLVRASGVELEPHGADWCGCCPFHDDHARSLLVTSHDSHWRCTGVCQTGGGVIEWVMRRDRVSFRRAVEWLRGVGGQGMVGAALPGALTLDPTADAATLLREVVGFYHQALLASPEALAYLAKRGLDHREAIERFQLGFANRTLAYQLPPKVVKAGAAIRGRLQALGLLRASGHEHFTGSLVVPVINPAGEVVALYGRKIRDDLRAGTPYHLHVPEPLRGVWNEAALAESDEVIVCKGLLDALTFWVAGHRHVTAVYGVAGFTDDHRRAFAQYGAKRVLLAYDRDEAGETAAQALVQELQGQHRCYRVQLPLGLDVNAYACQQQSATEVLGGLLRRAVWLGGPAAGKAIEAAAGAPPFLTAPVSEMAPAASPEPPPPPAALPLTVVPLTATEQEVVLTLGPPGGERRYRARGLPKNLSPETLRVTLVVHHGADTYADSLDLYVARARANFVAQAAAALDLRVDAVQQDVGTLLLQLEQLRDQQLANRATGQGVMPGGASAGATEAAPAMTMTEEAAALALLRDPQLLDRLREDFARVGIVGETTNLLVGYLATVSRLLPRPLAVIIQSASAAGKTSLMDAILRFVPPEHRVHYAAMTGQALYYLGERDLAHKVLSVVEDEGAARASYALKLLQSEGELTIASTGKEPETGKLITQTYRVQGPVQLFLTTTALELDEELANRALVLTVDESAVQTRAIHQHQRLARTLDGVLARAMRDDLARQHQNAQRLLVPLAVVNPYAPGLTFGDGRPRTRRDHEKYLTLIDAVALLHQHQREHKTVRRNDHELTYIEVTPADIAMADQLAAEVLTRSLEELPPQTHRFLVALVDWVAAESERRQVAPGAFRFLGREIREVLGCGVTQTKRHLARLVELEYVLVHRSSRGPRVTYELVYEQPPAPDTPVFPVLGEYDRLRSGVGRLAVGAESAAGRPLQKATNSQALQPLTPPSVRETPPTYLGQPRAGSHVLEGHTHAAHV
jgi:DNA primase catalytic core